ncbi:EAL domain-containing protein [Pseudomonas sp.]|uniref:EAL domain-containing protein n=1 Tax=Pseudomonas sp. TaxID=306 RepID=UPI0027337960|nr:EAL domain-containing protein [Pseudomonas sp.]MDP3815819.1 EAL domain-containing protein [Pseudomonas sp.]
MQRVSATLLLCLVIWATPAASLSLTPEEQAWLAANPELRLGIDGAWPPFEFRDEQGHHQGLSADYVRLLEKRLKIELRPAPPSSWSAVMAQAKAGQVQLLPGVMATPARQQYLTFTRPYLDFPIVILTHAEGPQPRTMRELDGLKVAVVQDYAPHELLRQLHPNIQLWPRPSVAAALQALATGEADAMVGDLASSVWTLRQLKLEGLYINGETPYRYQLAMAVPKDQAILAGIIDKVFAELSPAQMAAMQEHWVGDLIDRRPFWRSLILFGLPGLMIALLIIASILRINRRLRSEMHNRALLETELRNREQHYRGLVESLNAVAWQKRQSDYCFTYVAPQAEKLLGYPLQNWLQPDFFERALHPDDRCQTLDYFRAQTQAGLDHSLDYRLLAADGRVVWVRDIVTLMPDAQTPYLRGLLIDITEAKQTEQALALSEQKFASVFHNCPDIIALIHIEDGRLVAVNATFEQQFGFASTEAIGRTGTELGLWTEPGLGPRILQRLREGNAHNIETTFRRRDGSQFTGLISAQKIAFDNAANLVVVVRDISELKDTQQRLQLSETKFAKAFHASPDGLLITRLRDGLVLDVNEGFSRITGYSASEAAEYSTLELGIWAHPEEREQMVAQVREKGFVREFCTSIRTKHGALRTCELSVQPIPIGGETCMLSIARDITERVQMQERLQQAATVFESTAEGVMITNLEQRITAVNRAFSQITGYSEAEALGQSPRLLASGNHDSAFYAAMWHNLTASGHWQGEIWNKRKNGELYPEWLTISAVRDKNDDISHFVGVFADISSLKHAQARLDHQAHHDPLTGLPNRMLFEARLRAALEDAQTDQRLGAVLFIDLDRFKHINDSLGHPVGDQLLKSIAERLKTHLRDIDTVARLGGDEFIILLPGLQHASDAERVAHKLLDCFNQPFEVDEQELFISASIGISRYPEDGEDVATLVKNADAAMYRSKARGRNRVELYTRDLTFQATERMALERELRRALERNELQLYYQPKLSLASQRLVGAEALLRWHHPLFGEIPPDRFIPLAEETGLIISLGDWVLEQTCRQMQQWQSQHAPFGPISVNLTGVQLRQPSLLARIASLLEQHGLAPGLLQLEITESFIMNQAKDALKLLHQLKNLGVQLAIDDFGTGYSSLSYLKRLPVDTLKIDQSFVRGLPNDPNDVAIARAIIALGRSMQLTVIAEGVETKAQELFLAAEGCEQIQGFVVSRAIQADAFAQNFLEPRHSLGTAEKAPV